MTAVTFVKVTVGAVSAASRRTTVALVVFGPVYGRFLSQVSGPVILHWLGPVFDPALAGYWGSADLDLAAETVLAIIGDHVGKVDGIKVPLLDRERELRLRAALPAGVRLSTGDDYHYADLVKGDDEGKGGSDALLGAFAAIAPAASAALQALDRGDAAAYSALIEPAMPLSAHISGAPTPHYKTGVAFLAWLAGYQPGSRWPAGCTALAARRTSPRCSGWPTRSACCRIPSSPRPACGPFSRSRGWRADGAGRAGHDRDTGAHRIPSRLTRQRHRRVCHVRS
jgi:hypothetical protein